MVLLFENRSVRGRVAEWETHDSGHLLGGICSRGIGSVVIVYGEIFHVEEMFLESVSGEICSIRD